MSMSIRRLAPRRATFQTVGQSENDNLDSLNADILFSIIYLSHA